MSIPLVRITSAALLLATLAGCGQSSDDKVTARNPAEYGIWASTTLEHLPPDDARVFQEAQQEIKLFIMAHSSATGSDAIDQAFLAKVGGLTVHQLMIQGLQDRLQRLQTEHDEAQKLYEQNSKMRSHGDASAALLASRVNEDKERADRSAAQLAATQSDLDRIKK